MPTGEQSGSMAVRPPFDEPPFVTVSAPPTATLSAPPLVIGTAPPEETFGEPLPEPELPPLDGVNAGSPSERLRPPHAARHANATALPPSQRVVTPESLALGSGAAARLDNAVMWRGPRYRTAWFGPLGRG